MCLSLWKSTLNPTRLIFLSLNKAISCLLINPVEYPAIYTVNKYLNETVKHIPIEPQNSTLYAASASWRDELVSRNARGSSAKLFSSHSTKLPPVMTVSKWAPQPAPKGMIWGSLRWSQYVNILNIRETVGSSTSGPGKAASLYHIRRLSLWRNPRTDDWQRKAGSAYHSLG